jgi:hypothetical protein
MGRIRRRRPSTSTAISVSLVFTYTTDVAFLPYHVIWYQTWCHTTTHFMILGLFEGTSSTAYGRPTSTSYDYDLLIEQDLREAILPLKIGK